MSNSIQARVKNLLTEVVPRKLQALPIDEGMSLRSDLGIDSIGLMSLAFRMEEEFGLDLIGHVQEVAAISTVADVHQLVERLGHEQGSVAV